MPILNQPKNKLYPEAGLQCRRYEFVHIDITQNLGDDILEETKWKLEETITFLLRDTVMSLLISKHFRGAI